VSRDERTIRDIRQRLVEARRQGRAALLDEVTRGLAELGQQRYRCCLVDYESCRPTFYVRLLGYERLRVRAELEFPIEPHLEAIQLVPLSHLVDYEEAEDPGALRGIYEGLAEYLHHRTAPLSRASSAAAAPRAGTAGQRRPGRAAKRRRRSARGAARRPRVIKRVLLAAGVWWGIAGVLASYGLFVFLVL